MFGQMQNGAPMQGGAGKGGIQQPMGGGGKGGMNRGPGGNAQNNPGMHQFAQLGQQFNGLGSAGLNQSFPAQPTGINPGQGPSQMISTPVGRMGGSPMANWQSMLKGVGSGGMPAFNLPMSYGGSKPAFGGGLDTSGMTPISANLTPPTPQPQEPIGGYINGQPAQFHYQAEALKRPAVNNAGLPTGGLLARLYGGG